MLGKRNYQLWAIIIINEKLMGLGLVKLKDNIQAY